MDCDFPTVNSNTQEITQILSDAKTIAIIGCSPNETKASNMVAKYLKNAGYKIVPVYPKEDEILGEKVYRSLSDIPCKVDIVNVFRKPAEIANVVEESISRGDIDCVWTQLGLVNNEAAAKAKEQGIKVVQNHCTKIEHMRLF